MKHLTRRQRAHSLLRGGRYFLLIFGILALSYVAYIWLDVKYFQDEQNRRFEKQLQELAQARRAGVENPAWAVSNGAPLGRIEIRAVGLAVMILEGVEGKTLLRAVGHIPGTALPGQDGNVALAAHRDTFFRPLRDIRVNDEIMLTTSTGSYRYRVASTQVVGPEAIEVLAASHEAILTLVTCYPFDFVGSAPRRFIVRAIKSSENAARFP